MFRLKMITFCKSATCPSSEDLLLFERSELVVKKSKEICAHLAACEFCAAEVEFYAHYPQDETTAAKATKTEIPSPLYDLAKALLDNKHKDFSLLNRLHCEAVET